jgi:hypothetical protein
VVLVTVLGEIPDQEAALDAIFDAQAWRRIGDDFRHRKAYARVCEALFIYSKRDECAPGPSRRTQRPDDFSM